MHLEARAVVELPTTTLTWSVQLKPFISISLWISKPYHLVFQTHNLVSSVEAISYPYHCGYPNHVISPSYLSQPLLGQFSWNHIISMLGISKPYHIIVVQTHNLVSSVKTISYPCWGYPNHIISKLSKHTTWSVQLKPYHIHIIVDIQTISNHIMVVQTHQS